MKQTLRNKLVIAGVLSLIIFLAAGSIYASPSFTSECGDCHSVSGSYTLSSNSSGVAKVGVPFTLRLVATKPAPGGTNFYISVQTGWEDNANFTFTPVYIQDNGAGDLTLANFLITIDVTFTPVETGIQTIRAWTSSSSASQVLDMPINVTTIDPPTIDSPPDMQIDEGNMTASVTWTGTSLYPDRYEVYDNEVLSDNGPWDGSQITFGLSTLSVGTHNLTCVVYDEADSPAADQVDVLVMDDVLPTINHLDNSTVSEGSATSLTWTPSDANPSSFEIYREGALVDSGLWGGGNILASLAGLTLGEYNYTCVVFDVSGNNASDTTFVTIIDDTVPIIDHPVDQVISLGATGETIEWNVTDLHPDTYIVYRDEVSIQSGSWDGNPVVVSLNGLGLGSYNFTLFVNDTSGYWISDQVDVTVEVPPEPTIDHPIDLMIPEGSTGETIVWTPDDVDPSRYEIYRDSILVKSGLWNSSAETISISLDGLPYGVYDYDIIVYDDLDNSATDLVVVTVYDSAAPTVDSPSDLIIDEGDVGQIITWSPDDLNPASYEIFVDGVLTWSGLWNSSSETIIASCNGLLYGTHTYTIYVTDVADSTVSDEVIVTVLDGTSPIVNSPSDISYVISTTGHDITWVPSDLHPTEFTVEINGVVVLSGGWDGSPIVINVDYLSIGSYEYTLTVTDVGGNAVSDIVTVTVTAEPTTPTTEEPTTTTTTSEEPTDSPEEIEELQETVRFGVVILAMGAIGGALSLLLIIDWWRKNK